MINDQFFKLGVVGSGAAGSRLSMVDCGAGMGEEGNAVGYFGLRPQHSVDKDMINLSPDDKPADAEASPEDKPADAEASPEDRPADAEASPDDKPADAGKGEKKTGQYWSALMGGGVLLR